MRTDARFLIVVTAFRCCVKAEDSTTSSLWGLFHLSLHHFHPGEKLSIKFSRNCSHDCCKSVPCGSGTRMRLWRRGPHSMGAASTPPPPHQDQTRSEPEDREAGLVWRSGHWRAEAHRGSIQRESGQVGLWYHSYFRTLPLGDSAMGMAGSGWQELLALALALPQPLRSCVGLRPDLSPQHASLALSAHGQVRLHDCPSPLLPCPTGISRQLSLSMRCKEIRPLPLGQ